MRLGISQLLKYEALQFDSYNFVLTHIEKCQCKVQHLILFQCIVISKYKISDCEMVQNLSEMVQFCGLLGFSA